MVSSYIVVCFLVLLVVIPARASRLKLSEFVSPCRSDDHNLNECVRLAMMKAIPKLAKGVREFGLLPFEPLEIPRLDIDQRGNGPIGLKISFINSKHHGLSQLIVNSIRVKPEKLFIEMNTTLPTYSISGDYVASGRVLLLPLSGSGPSNLSLNNVNITWRLLGEPETRHGKIYTKLTFSDLRITHIKSGSIRLEGLFQGDKILGESMNRILNENFMDVINELRPGLNGAFSELYLLLLKNMFSSIPVQDMYPGIDVSKIEAGSPDL